jgi:hypothetical protein
MAGLTVALVNGLAWMWRWAAAALLSPADAIMSARPDPSQAPLIIH